MPIGMTRLVQRIADSQDGSTVLSESLLHEAIQPGTWQHKAIETLRKGKEVTLPAGQTFQDKNKNTRQNIRVRW